MIKDLKLGFKSVKSRSNNIDLDKIKTFWFLFDIKITHIIDRNTLIVNIDEASINKSTKLNYPWGLKGMQIEVWNSSFAGSVSMIMVVCSNGAWLNMTLNQTIDSTNFA